VYDQSNAREGRFLASVLRGSVRALTGLIAKANNRNVGFTAGTTTIGIRGTGFDVEFDPESGDTRLWTWLGSIEVGPNGETALQILIAGQGLFIPRNGPIQQITNQPANGAQDPTTIQADPKLFSSDNVNDASEGLFVFVRDGHIEIVSGGQVLHLGKGEAGFAGDGTVGRPPNIPKFLDFDKIVLPTTNNALLVSILGEQNIPQDKKTCN